MDILEEVQSAIGEAKAIPSLADPAEKLALAVNRLGEVTMHMGQTAMSERIMDAFAFAYPFMEVMGDAIMAWMLLRRATIAAQRLEAGAKERDKAF